MMPSIANELSEALGGTFSNKDSFRNSFVGKYRYFWLPYKPALVIGRLRGSSIRWLYKVKGSKSDITIIPKDNIISSLGLDEVGFKRFEDVEEEVVNRLIKIGYNEEVVTSRKVKYTAKYATGIKEQGIVENFNGFLYHGTEDPFFISTIYMADNFGYGSHLQSLNKGDALSLTPNVRVARDFGNIIFKFKVNLRVYYATKDEDNFDDIDVPDECNAVAIPHQIYKEDEIAVIKWENYEQMEIVGVMLPTKSGKYKNYPLNMSRVEVYGEYEEIYLDYFVEQFGKEFLKFDKHMRDNGWFIKPTLERDECDFTIKTDNVTIGLNLGSDSVFVDNMTSQGIKDGEYSLTSLLTELTKNI